jgi:site-specific DNA-methyltransferase (adenine-specific)
MYCDSSASHHFRFLIDNVFGEKYFVNEIVLPYKRWSNSALHLLESHQNTFIYSRTRTYKFNRILTDRSPITNIDQILQFERETKMEL